MAQNPLEEYFRHNKGRLLHKWLHYFDIYDRHLSKHRNQEITVVEIGVFHGGSLQMWKDYFGPKARIVGVDIEPRCKALEESQVEVIIGDQGDRAFLRALREEIGTVDVLIDDGGHRVEQQIATFDVLFPAVRPGGTYLVEDLHTNYWRDYGGGYRLAGTFIELAKDMVDQMHAWHSKDAESFRPDDITRSVRSMHVYDSVIVFEKDEVAPPQHAMTGEPAFDVPDILGPTSSTFMGRLDD